MMEMKLMKRFLALGAIVFLTMGYGLADYTAKELNRLGNKRNYESKPSFSETLKALKRQQGVELDEDPLEKPWLRVEVVKPEGGVTESAAPSTLPKLEDLPPEQEAEAMGRYKTKSRKVNFQPMKDFRDRIKGFLVEKKDAKPVPSEVLVIPGDEAKKNEKEKRSWDEVKAEKGRLAKEQAKKKEEARKRAEEERVAREKAKAKAEAVAKSQAEAEAKKQAVAEKKRKAAEAKARAIAAKKKKAEEAKERAAAQKKKKSEEAKKRALAATKKKVAEEKMKKAKIEAERKKKVESHKKAKANKEKSTANHVAEIRKRIEAEREARLRKEGKLPPKTKAKEGMEPANPDRVRRYGAKGEKQPLLKRILSLGKKDKKEVGSEEKKVEKPEADGHILDKLLNRFKKQTNDKVKSAPENSDDVNEERVGGQRREDKEASSTSPIRRLVF